MGIHTADKKGVSRRTRDASADKDRFLLTEKRLYDLNTVKLRLSDNREDLCALEHEGIDALKDSARSFVSLIKPGMRLDKYEVHEAQVNYLKTRIRADEREVFLLCRALKKFADDRYYFIVEKRYFLKQSDDEIARAHNYDTTTIYRNRVRIVAAIAKLLYSDDV